MTHPKIFFHGLSFSFDFDSHNHVSPLLNKQNEIAK